MIKLSGPYAGSSWSEASEAVHERRPVQDPTTLRPGDLFRLEVQHPHYPEVYLVNLLVKFIYDGLVDAVEVGQTTGVHYWLHPDDLKGVQPYGNVHEKENKRTRKPGLEWPLDFKG